MARKHKGKGKRSRARQGNNAKHQHKVKLDGGKAAANTTLVSPPEQTLEQHITDPTPTRSRVSSAPLTSASSRRKVAISRASLSSSGTGVPAEPWDPLRELPTRGLTNLGNTCFFNSALQNVFKTRLLHEALFANPERRAGPFLGPISKAFRKSMLEMIGDGVAIPKNGSYSPMALLSAVRKAHPSFKGSHQQDAHEFFMRLLGTLEDEEDAYIKCRLEDEEEKEPAPEASGSEGRDPFRMEEGVDSGAEEVSSITGVDPSLLSRRATNTTRSAPGTSGAGKRLKENISRSDVLQPGEEIHGRSLSTSSDSSRGDWTSTDSPMSRSESPCDAAMADCCQTFGSAPTSRTKKSSMREHGGVDDALASGVEGAGNRCDKRAGGSRTSEEGSELNGTGGAMIESAGRRRTLPMTDDDGETTDEGDPLDKHEGISADGTGSTGLNLNVATADPPPHESPAAVGGAPSGTLEHSKKVVRRAAVTEVFGGSLCSVVTCTSCKARSFNTEPTICLSLVIPPIPRKTRSLTCRKVGMDAPGTRPSAREVSAKEKRKRARAERTRLKSLEAEAGVDALRELGQEEEIAVRPSPDSESTVVDGAVSAASQDLLTRESVQECLDCVISRVVSSSFVAKEEAMGPLGVASDVRIHGANSGEQAASTFPSDNNGSHVGNKDPRVVADLMEPGGGAVPSCAGDSVASNGFETGKAKLSLLTTEVVDELQVSRNEDVCEHSPNHCVPRHDPHVESAEVEKASPRADPDAAESVEDVASENAGLCSGESTSTLAAAGVDGECSKARNKDSAELGSGLNCMSSDQSLEKGLGENQEFDNESDHDPARGENNEALHTGGSSCAVPESPFRNLVEPPSRVVNSDGKSDPAAIGLYACLDQFFAEEELVAAEGNGYDCEKCRLALTKSRTAGTEGNEEAGIDEEKRKQDGCAYDDGGCDERSMGSTKRDARKRLLMLGEPPGVLVCHLKRLQAQKKILTRVEFPEELDMAPYFWRDPQDPISASATLYRLFGLVEHRGNRFGGHYVAYVKDTDSWKHASDLDIQKACLTEVMKSNAYMLFYERIDKDPSSRVEAEMLAKAEASSGSDGVPFEHSCAQDEDVGKCKVAEPQKVMISDVINEEGEKPAESNLDTPSWANTTRSPTDECANERASDLSGVQSLGAEGSEASADDEVRHAEPGNGCVDGQVLEVSSLQVASTASAAEIISTSEMEVTEPLHADGNTSLISTLGTSSIMSGSSLIVGKPVVTNVAEPSDREAAKPLIENEAEFPVGKEHSMAMETAESAVEQVAELVCEKAVELSAEEAESSNIIGLERDLKTFSERDMCDKSKGVEGERGCGVQVNGQALDLVCKGGARTGAKSALALGFAGGQKGVCAPRTEDVGAMPPVPGAMEMMSSQVTVLSLQ